MSQLVTGRTLWEHLDGEPPLEEGDLVVRTRHLCSGEIPAVDNGDGLFFWKPDKQMWTCQESSRVIVPLFDVVGSFATHVGKCIDKLRVSSGTVVILQREPNVYIGLFYVPALYDEGSHYFVV